MPAQHPPKALLDVFAIESPNEGYRIEANQARRTEIDGVLSGMVTAGAVTILSQPGMLVIDGDTAALNVESTILNQNGAVIGRNVFQVETTPRIVEAGVGMDVKVAQASADSRLSLTLQRLGMPLGTVKTSERLPPMGAQNAVYLWLPSGEGALLVEVTAAPMP